MAKYVIQSKRAEPPQGTYSQGWRAGDFIFVPGTEPVDPATGKIVGDTIEQQTEQTIDNIAALLEADGASLGDVVKVTALRKVGFTLTCGWLSELRGPLASPSRNYFTTTTSRTLRLTRMTKSC